MVLAALLERTMSDVPVSTMACDDPLRLVLPMVIELTAICQ